MNEPMSDEKRHCVAMFRAATGHSSNQVVKFLDLMTDDEILEVSVLWEQRNETESEFRAIGVRFREIHVELMKRAMKPVFPTIINTDVDDQ
jgi:hypothetical protein